MTTSYESVLQLVSNVASAPSDSERIVSWVTGAHIVGVARDSEGRIELFLVGSHLCPSSQTVGNAIEYRSWHRNAADPFEANRIRLPAVGHFDQVAAFVCTELLRAGVDESMRSAFIETEPIIELAIESLSLSNQIVIGLVGELLFLEAICRAATDDQVIQVVDSWDGWKPSSRDFSWGTTGVEVKTTTRQSSTHEVQGIHQVEPVGTDDDGGSGEERLLLVSIGLQQAQSSENTFSIPGLVDRILERIDQVGGGEQVAARFLNRVAEYGAGTGNRYNHGSAATNPLYETAFQPTFFRSYDLSDRAVMVLRRENLVDHQHVDIGSVRFRIDLPANVSFGNPKVGANQVAREVLGG